LQNSKSKIFKAKKIKQNIDFDMIAEYASSQM